MRTFLTATVIILGGCGDMWVEVPETTCSGGVWQDTDTGYTWQNPGPSDTYTWGEAILYCEGLTCDGHADWHLPTKAEVESILTADNAAGCYWKQGLTGECTWYWSSSAGEDGTSNAWNVNFNDGGVSNHDKDNDPHVRCVR